MSYHMSNCVQIKTERSVSEPHSAFSSEEGNNNTSGNLLSPCGSGTNKTTDRVSFGPERDGNLV